MSARALFKPIKATLQLSGITAMNTTLTNVLLVKMVFKGGGNPNSLTKVFKDASERIIKMVLERAADGGLTKSEIGELEEIAGAYREVLKLIE